MTSPLSVYGIIGNPLEHSLSPAMQNAAFKALEVEAEYKLFPLEDNELGEFFKNLHDASSPIFGLNVTVPYKEKAMKYMDNLSPLAQKVNALNTIVIGKDRKLTGYNTDSPGFMSHLEELQFDPTDKNIAILGAGGSARAIITALCIIPKLPKSIKVYNRTFERIEQLLSDLKDRVDISIVEPVMSIDDLNLRESELLVNTTSIGLKCDDPSLIEPEMFHDDLLVYDLIYNPKQTLLLKMAEAAGSKTSNGLGMLFYQGVLSLQHWADIEISEKIKMEMRNSLSGGS